MPIPDDSESTVIRQQSEEVLPSSAQRDRVPVLIVLEGNDKNLQHPLTHRETLIGRDREVDLRVRDPRVSRKHAKVLFSNLGQSGEIPDCRIVDLGSTNGTFLNGSEVVDAEGAWLQDRDRIRVGDTILGYFLLDEDTVSLT